MLALVNRTTIDHKIKSAFLDFHHLFRIVLVWIPPSIAKPPWSKHQHRSTGVVDKNIIIHLFIKKLKN